MKMLVKAVRVFFGEEGMKDIIRGTDNRKRMKGKKARR